MIQYRRVRLGWLKLHRKIVNWEWFNDDNMLRVFLFLLITANTRATKFDGVTIERGQVAISVESLRKTLNLSTQTVRTCLKRLKKTSEITTKVTRGLTNHFTIVTINKFDSYQERVDSGQQAGQRTAQQSNQHLHLNNKEEEIINGVEEITPTSATEKILIENLSKDTEWHSEIMKMFGITLELFLKRFNEFENSCRSRGKLHKDIVDIKCHFVDWLKMISNTTKNEKDKSGGSDKRRGIDPGSHSAEDYEESF